MDPRDVANWQRPVRKPETALVIATQQKDLTHRRVKVGQRIWSLATSAPLKFALNHSKSAFITYDNSRLAARLSTGSLRICRLSSRASKGSALGTSATCVLWPRLGRRRRFCNSSLQNCPVSWTGSRIVSRESGRPSLWPQELRVDRPVLFVVTSR